MQNHENPMKTYEKPMKTYEKTRKNCGKYPGEMEKPQKHCGTVFPAHTGHPRPLTAPEGSILGPNRQKVRNWPGA